MSLSGMVKLTVFPVVEVAAMLLSCTIGSPLAGLITVIADVLRVPALGSSSNVIETSPVFRLASNEVILGPTLSLMTIGVTTYGEGEVVKLRGNPAKSTMGSISIETYVFAMVPMAGFVLRVVNWLC